METIKIYHNPKCGTSRNTLALIRNSGVEPVVIEYLKTPPTRDELKQLISDMGGTVRNVLRQKETLYKELGLDALHWTDEQLLGFIGEHPILLQRPIVVTALAVAHSIQERTGLAIAKVVKQLRPLRSATIAINGTTETFPPEVPEAQQKILASLNVPEPGH